MYAPDVVDSDNPLGTFTGGLVMDFSSFGLRGAGPVLDDDSALAVLMAVILADAGHELCEWLRIDGERVFTPHTSAGAEWTVLGQAGLRMARRMLAEHPRAGRPVPDDAPPDDGGDPAFSDDAALDAEEELGALLRRISYLPEHRFEADTGRAFMVAPRVVNVDDPSTTFAGSLVMDLESLPVPLDGSTVTLDAAIRVAICLALISASHELCEWLRLDGERVFTPHTPSYVEWTVLADIAAEAADLMLREHPAPA